MDFREIGFDVNWTELS